MLRIKTEAEATTLNPYMPSPGYSRFVSGQLFQTLGYLDPKTFELQPMLVEKIPQTYQVKEGKFVGMLAADFSIRPEAIWDNNTPVTAKDVEFTLKTIFNPYLPTQAWRGYFERLQHLEVNAQNPKQFTVYFDKYYLLAIESMCQVPILPAHVYDAAGTLNPLGLDGLLNQSATKSADTVALKSFATAFQDPKLSTDPTVISGSSPYKIDQIQPGESITLVRKLNFWGDKLPATNALAGKPEKIVYRTVKDEAATESLMRNQDVDLGIIVNVQKFLDMQKDAELTKNYDLLTQTIFQYGYWMFNTKHPILQDKVVRQALAQVVNYDQAQRDIYQGLATRTVGPISPLKPYYNKDIRPYAYDLAAAANALEGAGWKDTDQDGIRDKVINGKKTKLAIKTFASGAISTKMAENIKSEAKKVGVEVTIETMDINVLTQKTKATDFETAILAAATFPGYEDLYQLYHSNSSAPKGDNRSQYTSVAADSLIELIRSNPDATTRAEQYKQFQALLHDELPHVYCLYHNSAILYTNATHR